MPVFDPLLTGVLLLGVAAWTWFFVRDIDKVASSPLDDCWPLVPLDPLTCTISDEPPADRATANLYVVAIQGQEFWACCTTDCHRVHRTYQGAAFCSLMEFDAPAKHPAV